MRSDCHHPKLGLPPYSPEVVQVFKCNHSLLHHTALAKDRYRIVVTSSLALPLTLPQGG